MPLYKAGEGPDAEIRPKMKRGPKVGSRWTQTPRITEVTVVEVAELAAGLAAASPAELEAAFAAVARGEVEAEAERRAYFVAKAAHARASMEPEWAVIRAAKEVEEAAKEAARAEKERERIGNVSAQFSEPVPGLVEKGELADLKAHYLEPGEVVDRFLEDVCDRMRNMRVKAGLSKIQTARACGMDINMYTKLERGHLPLTLPKLRRVAAVLGVSLAVFFDTKAEVPEIQPVIRESWLVTEPPEKNLLRVFRTLRGKERRIVFGHMRVLIGSRERAPGEPKDPFLKGVR